MTLRVVDRLAGDAPPEGPLVVEEEGWLEDGTPIVVDGAPASKVGDDAIWFLDAVGTEELPVYVAVSAQGRYLVVDGDLVGADGDDPLIAELAVAHPGPAPSRHRRVAELVAAAAIIPRCPDRPACQLAAACVGCGVLLCLSLPPFGFWPLAAVGLVGLDRLIADQPATVRFRRGWLVAMGCFVPSLVWMTALTAPGYVIACAAYSGMLGAGVAAAPPGRGRWLALAGTWTLAELLRWTWPFGGVPLANLAIGQVAGPLAPVLRVGGSLLLVLVAVLAGQASPRRRGGRGSGPAASPSVSP